MTFYAAVLTPLHDHQVVVSKLSMSDGKKTIVIDCCLTAVVLISPDVPHGPLYMCVESVRTRLAEYGTQADKFMSICVDKFLNIQWNINITRIQIQEILAIFVLIIMTSAEFIFAHYTAVSRLTLATT